MEAIYYDWSTSSWGTLGSSPDSDGKNGDPETDDAARTPIKGPPNTRRAVKRTPTFVILLYNSKNAHKWHGEGIPPARRNYLGLYFRFAYYLNSIPLAPRARVSCRLFPIWFHSWLWIWMDSERGRSSYIYILRSTFPTFNRGTFGRS